MNLFCFSLLIYREQEMMGKVNFWLFCFLYFFGQIYRKEASTYDIDDFF